MKLSTEKLGTIALALIGLMIVGMAFIVSDGLFTVDEVVYYLGAKTMADNLSFVFENGYDVYGSNNLIILTTVVGPSGLVPQYPVGTAVIGAPLVYFFGVRGLIILNAMAAVGTIFLTRALARRLYGDEKVALTAAIMLIFCTFFIEYAWGVWPHAISAFLVTASMVLAFDTVNNNGRKSFALACGAGLIIGIGFLIRVDAVLILPPIAILIILYAPRPMFVLFCGTAGLLPAMIAASLANHVKFGHWNPLSYGSSSGGTDPTTHIGIALLVLGFLVALFAARLMSWRPRWHPRALYVAVGSLALLSFGFPQIQDGLVRYINGAYSLIVDITLIEDARAGIIQRTDGTLQFWGMPKKALGQSMPWIGILVFLIIRPWDAVRIRSHLFCISALVIWMLPFMMISWHGGSGSNMRYFIPILPLVAILATLSWFDIIRDLGRPFIPAALFGPIIGFLLPLVWARLSPTGAFGAQQIMTTYCLIAMFVLTLLSALSGPWRGVASRVIQFAMVICLGISAMLGVLGDPMNAQFRRTASADASRDFAATIESPSLIIANVGALVFQFDRPQGLIGKPTNPSTGAVDLKFLRKVLADGYRVYVKNASAAWLLKHTEDLEIVGAPIKGASIALFEIQARTE